MRQGTNKNERQKGFSLVELMVSVLIGMLAVYASYRVFENVETNYRATETTNEAQMAGLYATFAISQELSNAGAGVMSNFGSLQGCTNVTSFPNSGTGSPPLPLYPLPVAVIPTADSLLDDLFVFYGTGNFTDLPIRTTVNSPQSFSLQAPLGLAARSTLITGPGGSDPNCRALEAQSVSTPGDDGVVTVTLGGAQSIEVGPVIDLGNAVRRRFFVDGNRTLQMEVWQVDANAGNNRWQVTRTVPIASNVIAFKAQYGIAPSTPPIVGAITDWVTPNAAMLSEILGGVPSARNIKAIRFGLIVRAAEPDPVLGIDPATKDPYTADRFATETLLECPSGWTCSGGPSGDGSQSASLLVSEANKPYGWRYRKYETTVPLQNTIWN